MKAPFQNCFVKAASIGVWLVSCTAVLAAKAPPLNLSWPPPPDKACVVYSRSISRPSDIGASASMGSRVARFLTGTEQQSQGLSKPFGLCLDENGNLIVTDTELGAVFLLDSSRKIWLRWNSIDKLRFATPVGVAAGKGSIYVADSGLGKVVAFTEKGKLLWDSGEQFRRPTGVALGQAKLFVADAEQHEVFICNLLGHIEGRFGKRGGAPGEFNSPTHISADPNGNIYVTDSLNCRIQIFDSQGRYLRAVGRAGDAPGCFSRPKGASADNLGHLFVVDALFDNFQIFDETGRLLLNVGESGSDRGEFWLPNAIAINASNEIFVTDTYNHRIQVFQLVGEESRR